MLAGNKKDCSEVIIMIIGVFRYTEEEFTFFWWKQPNLFKTISPLYQWWWNDEVTNNFLFCDNGVAERSFFSASYSCTPLFTCRSPRYKVIILVFRFIRERIHRNSTKNNHGREYCVSESKTKRRPICGYLSIYYCEDKQRFRQDSAHLLAVYTLGKLRK